MILGIGSDIKVSQAATSSDSYSVNDRSATGVVYRSLQTTFAVSTINNKHVLARRVSGNALS